MAHVLIATLGDSPIVVTSMFYLLTEQQHQTIDKVIVLHSQGTNREDGYENIKITLEGQGLCDVDQCELPFEDCYTEPDCFVFLHYLFKLLSSSQAQRDSVSLSLAGGRKNMSALLGLAAPFYSCVKRLYHIIDKSEHSDRRNFKTIEELNALYSDDTAGLLAAMHPSLDDLQLVSIPLKNALRVSEAYRQKLATMSSEQLQTLWETNPDEAEQQQFMLTIVQPELIEPLLQVRFTEKAKEEYEGMAKYEDNLAERFRVSFKHMRFAPLLKANLHNIDDPKKKKPGCYVYKAGSTKERPFFHTEPGDITKYPQSVVHQVIVERLTSHRSSEKYYEPPMEQLLETKYNKGDKLYSLEEVLHSGEPIPSVLIVPMGTQPMIATQLYTLLTTRERRAIQQVILVYPQHSNEVKNSVDTAKKAFAARNIPCKEHPIRGLADIASEEDGEQYQDTLEQLINGLKATFLQQHPEGRIDLSLSGGRKGMAALALFAAQRTQLHAVYHTLITDRQLEEQIEDDMSENVFHRLKQSEKNARLFLDVYDRAGFQLFRIPIGPLHSAWYATGSLYIHNAQATRSCSIIACKHYASAMY